MTAQCPEVLFLNGEKHSLCSYPLSDYFYLADVGSPFAGHRLCTALWRNYIGTWSLDNDRLYLISIKGWREGIEEPVGTEVIFPGHTGRVFAHWFSGVLQLPQGGMLGYEPGHFESQHECDLFLRFESGCLVERRIRFNALSSSEVR